MLKICTVYDSKAEAYFTPMFFKNRAEAVRSFTEAAMDKATMLGKYPADFTMFELGTYDELTGKFVINSTPTSIGCALEFLSSQPVVSDSVVGLDALAKAKGG